MMLWYILFGLICCILNSVTGTTRVCSTRYFDGSSTADSDRYVYCGNGYHVCSGRPEGCCPDSGVDPFPLALVIMGPLTLLCSLALVAFVMKICIGTLLEEKDNYEISREQVADKQ